MTLIVTFPSSAAAALNSRRRWQAPGSLSSYFFLLTIVLLPRASAPVQHLQVSEQLFSPGALLK